MGKLSKKYLEVGKILTVFIKVSLMAMFAHHGQNLSG